MVKISCSIGISIFPLPLQNLEWVRFVSLIGNMIKEVHGILLDSVRGKDKGRGRFRTVQNWIGKPGTPMERADYVPPEPMRLMEFLSDLEKYVHYEEKDVLVQLAIVHAQFEIIHLLPVSQIFLKRAQLGC